MRRIVILLFLTVVAIEAAAQAVPFVTIRTDAGQLALGGASVASGTRLPVKDGIFEVGAGKILWQTKSVKYNLTNLDARIKVTESFTAGLEYTSNNMGEMDRYSDNGQRLGTFQPGEMCAALRLSYNPARRLNINAAGKIIRSSLSDSHTASTYAANLGAIFIISEAFRAGFAAENIGGKMDYGYGAYPLPTTFKAGACGTITLSGKHTVEFAADGGTMPSAQALLASIGGGYCYNNMIAVRCGAHICTKETVLPSYFSAGLFFKSTIFDIGAAWLSASSTYSISARLKL